MLALPFRAVHAALSPVVAPVAFVSRSLLRWTGGRRFTGHLFGNRDELRVIMLESAQTLGTEERGMISRVLDLQNLTVAAITTPMDKATTASAEAPVDEALLRELLSPRDLVADIEASLNLGELAKRQFRDVARVAGLLPPSLPGRAARSLRQLQASSGLLYDVLQRHDPGHRLLAQAARDVLEAPLAFTRLRDSLERLAARSLRLASPSTLTPLAFPLWADRMRGSLSTEDWRTRVERAAAKLEAKYA